MTDDGVGISDEDKIRLFEPNFSTKKSGMGLGLTIVNSIVTDHNGRISRPGQLSPGRQVRDRIAGIKAMHVKAIGHNVTVTAVFRIGTPGLYAGGLLKGPVFMFPTILIVDDEVSIVQSLSGLLTDEGFEVTSASNGYEALQQIETEAPDLVLLDIWMPGIDGIETLKEIKQKYPHIQVIMITGHGTIETAVRATKHGAFDFIEKPLSIDKVIVAINNALNFRRLEEENRYLRKKTIEKHSITGNSEPIRILKETIAKVAPSDSWVLIKGENGTGKELGGTDHSPPQPQRRKGTDCRELRCHSGRVD